MIKKPEDAVPMAYHEYAEKSRDDVFTAAETAQIAKAYLAAYLKEKRALLRPDSEHKKAAANLRAWRSKLKELEVI